MFRRYLMSGFTVLVLAFFASARQPAQRTDLGAASGIKHGTHNPPSAQENKKPSREPQPFGSGKPVYKRDAVCTLSLKSMHEKLKDANMQPPSEKGVAGPSTRKVEAMIALVPDPIHTHLALTFDRTVDTIQQALQDAPAMDNTDGWVYTSQWLPWDPMPYQAAEDPIDRTNARTFDHGSECAPGVLIFHDFQASRPSRFLVVLLVGESPTGGINERQFENALEERHTIERKASAAGSEASMLHVLGPTFSTSLFSLDHLLHEHSCSTKKTPDCIETAQVISGSVSEDPLTIARDFKDLESAHFLSLTESAASRRKMILAYFLKSEKIANDKVALLSEDQTQFGNFSGFSASDPAKGKEPDPDTNGPLIFHFPREISQLRNAYEENSILSASSSNQNQNVPNQALKLSLEDRHEQEDDVPSFSNQQDSISQESILSSITRTMASHDIRVVVISATDVLDEMFVARFLSRDLPNARIVLTDADQILLRRGDAGSFRGMLTATTYPLIQDDTDWNAPLPAGQSLQLSAGQNLSLYRDGRRIQRHAYAGTIGHAPRRSSPSGLLRAVRLQKRRSQVSQIRLRL